MAADRGQPAVPLGGAGSMPLVGFGTWQMTGTRCREAVTHALKVGYRHIDTATMYRNEREVGRAIRDSGVPRQEVFVTTKLPPGATGRERRTLDDSLRALGTDYVDLWLVHWPPRGRALVSTWQELLAVRDAGLAHPRLARTLLAGCRPPTRESPRSADERRPDSTAPAVPSPARQ